MKRIVAVVFAFGLGLLLGIKTNRNSGEGVRGVSKFGVNQPDPSSPNGRSIKWFDVYKTAHQDRLEGSYITPTSPPWIITVQGDQTVAYYGVDR